MSPAPDRYAVIGHPIAHSRSPWIHAQFARQTGEHIRYEAIDIAPAELAARLRPFFAQGGRGLNVTVPHKQAVLPLLDELSDRARIAGAVNTVIGQPELRSALQKRPANAAEMFQHVAAQEVVHRRDVLLRTLRQQGVHTLEVDPEKLSSSVVNQYLSAKERSLI